MTAKGGRTDLIFVAPLPVAGSARFESAMAQAGAKLHILLKNICFCGPLALETATSWKWVTLSEIQEKTLVDDDDVAVDVTDGGDGENLKTR